MRQKLVDEHGDENAIRHTDELINMYRYAYNQTLDLPELEGHFPEELFLSVSNWLNSKEYDFSKGVQIIGGLNKKLGEGCKGKEWCEKHGVAYSKAIAHLTKKLEDILLEKDLTKMEKPYLMIFSSSILNLAYELKLLEKTQLSQSLNALTKGENPLQVLKSAYEASLFNIKKLHRAKVEAWGKLDKSLPDTNEKIKKMEQVLINHPTLVAWKKSASL